MRMLLACLALLAAWPARPDLMEDAAKLVPVAARARAAVLNHATLAPFEIESVIEEALTAASMVGEGPGEYERKLKAIGAFEPRLGPAREIPSIRMHLILGAVAEEEDRKADSGYHRAYVVAIMKCIASGADGTSPQSPYKVVMVDDEYQFFRISGIRVQPRQRVAREIDGRMFDIWTLGTRDGKPYRLYFDVTEMQEAFARILKARGIDRK